MRAIYLSIPTKTRLHGELAATVAEHIVTALRLRIPQSMTSWLSARFWTAGRRAAVSDLARALNDLSARHFALGRHEEALRAVSEAVSIWERLVAVDSSACLADLAAALNNKANCLDKLDRRQEGLGTRHRAVEAYWRLTGPVPQVFNGDENLRCFADLATALNNLSIDLEGPEGLLAAEKSVTICERLTVINETFKPDLARSLNSLSLSLSGLGRFMEAADAARQAVELYEPLTRARPDMHLPGLAASYNNLTRCLVELGQTRQALTASTEAKRRYRQLAHAHPAVYRPDLARAYSIHADRLAELGDYEGALLDIAVAIKLYRSLMKERSDAVRADLVRSLRIRADRLREVGRPDLADEADAEARRLIRPGASR
jgi:tetratricopeptide (TPR) repeat protein